ncbi:MAG: sigma-70 family RNA polymerase sigma factor [Ruminococcaceae bacterium]|nr:sigma-70 family RNA polymerase sigma factor [Oscillospiraceae bacterium]
MILKKAAIPPQDEHKTSPPKDDDCEKLIASAKNGDSNAFGQLVEIYEKFVYAAACRTLSVSGLGTSEAEDIAQASFLKAWRSLASFREDCAFSTWLYRITLNTAKDYIRSHVRHGTLPLCFEEGEDGEECIIDIPVTEGADIPEDALDKKELILAVREAIEKLPEDQKKVIILRDIHELPYSDISAMLGIEIGTVKSRINRGRQALKAILSTKNLL